jgi:hypothetical protein
MRSGSGTNSLHSRITSPVQRSAASEDCADAGLLANTAIVRNPAAHSADRDKEFEKFFTR